MFNIFSSNKSEKSKTGFYKVENNKLIAINEAPGNGSINSIIEFLGYPRNYIHTVNTFDSKKN